MITDPSRMASSEELEDLFWQAPSEYVDWDLGHYCDEEESGED